MSTDADQRSGAPSTRSVLKVAGASAGVRFVVMGLSAVLGLVTTRLIVDAYGVDAYAQYGLLVGLIALIPFADLGLSAAVMNAIGASDDPAHDEYVRRVLTTTMRVLLVGATILLLVVVGVGAFGWWPQLLGDGLDPSANVVVTVCLAVLALGMPFGLGQRVLTAVGRNHVQIAVMGLQSPLVLLVLGTAVATATLGPQAIAVVPFAVMAGLGVVLTVLAARTVSPTLVQAARDVPAFRSKPGAKVLDVAWPMMVQMLLLPVAMQTNRIVLSHTSSTDELASYGLASQMFLPLWALIGAAGMTLWPMFARARREQQRVSPFPMAALFAGIAVVATGSIALASPLLASVATDDQVSLSPLLVSSFAVLMVLQAAKFPLGMSLTDASGLRFQALMTVLMVPVNLGLSIVLARSLGAAGPVLGSIVGVLLFQVLGYAWAVRRRQRYSA